jgi:hypothetical protein
MKKKLLIFSLLLTASVSTSCYWGYGGYGWGGGYGFGWGLGAAALYGPLYNPYYYHPYPYYAPPAQPINPATIANIKDQSKLNALKAENNRKERELEAKRRDKLNAERKQLEADRRKELKIQRQQELDSYDNGDNYDDDSLLAV